MQEYQKHRDLVNLNRFDDLELVNNHIPEILILKFIIEKLSDCHIIKLINIFLQYIQIMNLTRIAGDVFMSFKDVFGYVLNLSQHFRNSLLVLWAKIYLHHR